MVIEASKVNDCGLYCVQGIFDKKTVIDRLEGGPAGSGDIPTEKESCCDCKYMEIPSNWGICRDCTIEHSKFTRRDE